MGSDPRNTHDAGKPFEECTNIAEVGSDPISGS